jgi:hypothetical protein
MDRHDRSALARPTNGLSKPQNALHPFDPFGSPAAVGRPFRAAWRAGRGDGSHRRGAPKWPVSRHFVPESGGACPVSALVMRTFR